MAPGGRNALHRTEKVSDRPNSERFSYIYFKFATVCCPPPFFLENDCWENLSPIYLLLIFFVHKVRFGLHWNWSKGQEISCDIYHLETIKTTSDFMEMQPIPFPGPKRWFGGWVWPDGGSGGNTVQHCDCSALLLSEKKNIKRNKIITIL